MYFWNEEVRRRCRGSDAAEVSRREDETDDAGCRPAAVQSKTLCLKTKQTADLTLLEENQQQTLTCGPYSAALWFGIHTVCTVTSWLALVTLHELN